MKHIEEYAFDDYLPVNTIAMASRLKEILKEAETNSFLSIKEKLNKNNDPKARELSYRFRACLWLINQQVFGQLGEIDLCDEWDFLNKMFKE